MRRDSRNTGFTLIEVLVAAVFLGVFATIFLGGIIGSLSFSRRSQDTSGASAWIQGEIEFVRRQCFASLTPSWSHMIRVSPTPQPGEAPPPAGFAAGYVQIDDQIDDQINSSGTHLLQARICLSKVDWAGGCPPPDIFLSPNDMPLNVVTYVADIRRGLSCE
jgi:prepilin-type N-terminal cleavage/methylation domain-containing protein